MYVLIAGGGKAGANVMRSLLRAGHEVTLIEQDRDRFEQLEAEFEHQVMLGDATEIFILEKAGIRRPPDLVLSLPEGARLISVMRDGKAEIAVGATRLAPGDQVLAILEPGKEDELRRVLLKR